MFNDKVLNRSFLASLGANLVLVSLVGGSDLLKYGPAPVTRVIKRLPFIMTTPPPPEAAQVRPAARKPVAHQPVHRIIVTARVAPKSQAHPVRTASLTDGTRVARPTAFAAEPNAGAVTPTTETGSGGQVGTGATKAAPPIEYIDDHPHREIVTEEGAKTVDIPQKEPAKETEPPRPVFKSALADRTDPKALTEWTDIASSVQFDPQTLSDSTIKVQFEVDATGVPSHVKVIQSCGIPELDQNAIDACRAMRFLPAVQDGVARSVTYEHDFVVSN